MLIQHLRQAFLVVVVGIIAGALATQAQTTTAETPATTAAVPITTTSTTAATGSIPITTTVAPTSTGRAQPSQRSDQSPVEVVRLETEVRLLREFHEHILATVLWSLGVTLTIAILLVGYNWYSNVRAYERDKEAMHRELHVSLREKVAALSSEVDAKVAAATEALTTSVRADFDKLVASIADQSKKDRETLDGRIRPIIGRVKQLELAQQLAIAEEGLAEAKRNKVLGNIIISAAEVADVAAETSDRQLLHTSAVDALDAVRAILADPNHRVLPFTLMRGNDLLKRLPKDLGALRNELADQLEKLKLRKPMEL